MELLITSTDQLTRVDGQPCRVWEGWTDDGQRCLVFVVAIGVPVDADVTAFTRELQAHLPAGRAVELRFVR